MPNVFIGYSVMISNGISDMKYLFDASSSQQVLRGVDDPTGMRKEVKSQESALTLQAIWDFEVSFSILTFDSY